ncbi:DoxX family protein [Flindersiella endophytica]
MAPLIALIGGSILFRLLGLAWSAFDSWQPALAGGLAAMFVVTGLAHFVGPLKADLVAMVPPRLPRPELLVALTGGLELLGAAGLLLPATRTAAAVCLALLMVAMFPANVYAARRDVPLGGRPATPLVPRTLMQLLFVGACVAVVLG